jgi:hypothetical protein
VVDSRGEVHKDAHYGTYGAVSVWGSLADVLHHPKSVWSGAQGTFTTHRLEHSMAASKVSAADRKPKISHLEVRARLFAVKQDLSL